MLYFDRIDASEGIDVRKTIALKECIICQFLLKGLHFSRVYVMGVIIC